MASARETATIEPLRFEEGVLLVLDQRALPDAERWIPCQTPEQVADCIRTLAVRGAPAIGLAAAYAMALADDREAAALVGLVDGLAVQATFEPRLLSPARQVELVDACLDRLRA